MALPNTKNDFYLLRCLMKNKDKLDDVIMNYIQDATTHVLADVKKLNLDSMMEVLRDVSFDSRKFYNAVLNKYPEMAEFDGSNPERHINYWDFDTLVEIMHEVGFDVIIPTYQGSSVASPFCNLHVFDSSEPHISFYADIIK